MSTARSIRCSSGTVALKVIGTQIDSNPETHTRFLREARAAGQLSHRNIVTIYDLGEHDGHPFLAMEYLEGEDLQQRLSGHVKMSIARKVDLAIDICEGLEYAHAHGVVHRDVKPANVFITTSGQVKILDFGLARLITSQLTNSNMLMGTLNYMAPEQVRGERADHRADIFSVGVLYYELLCNKKAFEGDSFASTMYKILQEVPEPICQVDATVPRALAAIVEHALAKPLDERYQSMTALREDLLLYRDQIRKSDSGALSLSPTRPGLDARRDHDALTRVRTRPVGRARIRLRRRRGGSCPVRWRPVRRHAIGRGSVGRRRPAATAPSGSGVTRVTFATRWPWISSRALSWRRVRLPYRGSCRAISRRMRQPQKIEQPAPPIDMSDAVATAQRSLDSHDYAAAEQQAQAILQQAPGDREARRILDRARSEAAAVENGLREARASLASGDFQAASRAAGDVLTVDGGNARGEADHGAGRHAGWRAQCRRCEDPDDRRARTGARRQRADTGSVRLPDRRRAPSRAHSASSRPGATRRRPRDSTRPAACIRVPHRWRRCRPTKSPQPNAAPAAPPPPVAGTSSGRQPG